jgi:hypothetical protein
MQSDTQSDNNFSAVTGISGELARIGRNGCFMLTVAGTQFCYNRRLIGTVFFSLFVTSTGDM